MNLRVMTGNEVRGAYNAPDYQWKAPDWGARWVVVQDRRIVLSGHKTRARARKECHRLESEQTR